jgi:hypothetical protein
MKHGSRVSSDFSSRWHYFSWASCVRERNVDVLPTLMHLAASI